jgi:hypothetical protein
VPDATLAVLSKIWRRQTQTLLCYIKSVMCADANACGIGGYTVLVVLFAGFADENRSVDGSCHSIFHGVVMSPALS